MTELPPYGERAADSAHRLSFCGCTVISFYLIFDVEDLM